jgi:hypothetical protein
LRVRGSFRRLSVQGSRDPISRAAMKEREPMKRIILIAAVLAGSAALAHDHPTKQPGQPGLGEFMTATQLRHAKLWFAGKAGNWDLASYEVDEIKEGLGDAASLYPTHEGAPVAEMIKTIIDPRIERLEKAIEAKSGAQFAAAFDELTKGCNSCHAAAGKPFIRIQRPSEPPLSNQNFAPAK